VAPGLLTEEYSAVKSFDASARLAAYGWLPGRGYLGYDEKFVVFKRKRIRSMNQSRHQEQPGLGG
jgi:hypothetical protein